MGAEGARLTGTAVEVAEALVDDLSSIGEVSSRKMFGGVGIFADGSMFTIVDGDGRVFFRVNESTAPRYVEAGSEKHARMPYWSVPQSVLNDPDEIVAWGTQALQAAQAK
jgi:DNA transformation protein